MTGRTPAGPAQTPPLRVAQIGTGAWGRRWTSVLAGAACVELTAVVDVDVGAAQQAVRPLARPVPCFGSVEAMSAAGLAPDALIVTVPAEAHADVVCEAVHAGWHCLVEKPVAHSVAAAHRMIRAADAAGRSVMVSHNYRFKHAPRAVRTLVEQGRVGAVGQVWIDYRATMPFEGFMLRIEEPLLSRYLVHHLDLCRFVTGKEFRRIRARSWNPPWSRFAGNASAVVELEGDDGVVVVWRGSWCAPGRPTQWEGSWHIDGGAGALSWCDDTIRLRPTHPFDTVDVPGTRHRGDDLELAVAPSTGSQQAMVLDRFVHALRCGEPPQPDLRDGLATLELLLAALVSARSGGEWVDVAQAALTAQLGPHGLVRPA